MRYRRGFENAHLAILVVLLVACFLMGGASRLDVASLVLLQPLAALCAMAFLLIPTPRDWRPVRIPLLLLSALASVIAAQLVPLPPVMWSQLPGHQQFAQSLAVAGVEPAWRPMSLTPDLTLASLVGLVVPLAVLLGFASLKSERRRTLLVVLIGGSVCSSMFGLAQVSGGPQSSFYLYDITNVGASVGLFSNRNHQAVLLAMTWPMLAAWAMLPRRDRRSQAASRWVTAGFAVFLLPILLVTGSRAGLLLGIVGLCAAGAIWRWRRPRESREERRFERLILPLAGLMAAGTLLATVMLSRAEAIQRILNLDGNEARLAVTPTLIGMAGDFFPLGSGFGSFDPAYRSYETYDAIDTQYLNHAHNDLLELVITGGLPALTIGIIFVGWALLIGMRAWRSQVAGDDQTLARLGCVMTMMVLASSLVDYPLRTPLMMAIVAVSSSWLGAISGSWQRPAHAV